MRLDGINRYLTFKPRVIGAETFFPIAVRAKDSDLCRSNCVRVKRLGKANFFDDANTGAVYSSGFEAITRLFRKRKLDKSSPFEEINALVALEANGIVHSGIERGMYGLRAANGDIVVVSRKVKGALPDIRTNKFNQSNLRDLVGALHVLDTPSRYWNHHNPYKLCKPMSIPMHNDLSRENIFISDKGAEIVGFKNLDFVKIKDLIEPKVVSARLVENDISDIPNVPSNLRAFEQRVLLPYIEGFGEKSEEAKSLFVDYLRIKSSYHNKMDAAYFKSYILNIGVGTIFSGMQRKILGFCRYLGNKHKMHSKVLCNPTDAVIKAEAMKIQLARYMYLLGRHGQKDNSSVSVAQVANYLSEVDNFMQTMSRESRGLNKSYYQDCVGVVACWKEILNCKKAASSELLGSLENGSVADVEKFSVNSGLTLDKIVDFNC